MSIKRIAAWVYSQIDEVIWQTRYYAYKNWGMVVRYMVKGGILVFVLLLPILVPLLAIFALADKFPAHRELLSNIGIGVVLILLGLIVVAMIVVATYGINESIRRRRSVKRYEAELRSRDSGRLDYR